MSGQHVLVPKANVQVKSNVQMIKEMCKCKKCTDDKFNLHSDDDHDDKLYLANQKLPDI